MKVLVIAMMLIKVLMNGADDGIDGEDDRFNGLDDRGNGQNNGGSQ